MADARAAAARAWPLVSLLLLLGLVVLLAPTISPEISRATTTMLVNLIVVVGLYVFIGNTGIFSFGHTAFMAVGAYVAALLAMPVLDKELFLPDLPDWIISAHFDVVPAILVGGLVAALLALVVGIPIVRMSPLAGSLGTFAVLAIVFNVLNNWQAVGGSTGISGVPDEIANPQAFLWAVAMLVLVFVYQSTRWCLRLRASRDDEAAARSLGVPVERDRYVALALSAFVVGIGGGVYALNLGFFTANVFFLETLFLTLVMLLVGGSTSLAGAVVGVLVISALQELLKNAEDSADVTGFQNLVLATILILIMIWRPLGIMGGKEITWPFGRRTETDRGSNTTAEQNASAPNVAAKTAAK